MVGDGFFRFRAGGLFDRRGSRSVVMCGCSVDRRSSSVLGSGLLGLDEEVGDDLIEISDFSYVFLFAVD